jgi:hypothetical protein
MYEASRSYDMGIYVNATVRTFKENNNLYIYVVEHFLENNKTTLLFSHSFWFMSEIVRQYDRKTKMCCIPPSVDT